MYGVNAEVSQWGMCTRVSVVLQLPGFRRKQVKLICAWACVGGAGGVGVGGRVDCCNDDDDDDDNNNDDDNDDDDDDDNNDDDYDDERRKTKDERRKTKEERRKRKEERRRMTRIQ